MRRYFSNIFNKGNKLEQLEKSVIELNTHQELKKIYGWNNEPILDVPSIFQFEYVEDVNNRRLLDAQSIGTVMCNANPGIALEIGTASGHTTALMAINAPASKVYTINIPPEEILNGKGGNLTTTAMEKDKIGEYYRNRGLANIIQIYANSSTWKPDIGTIDVAFIDGCHDTDFVYNDTKKVLRHMKANSFVLWHDFNPVLANKYEWIMSVCKGVERLCEDGLVNGKIFHIRDSWVGIYKVS